MHSEVTVAVRRRKVVAGLVVGLALVALGFHLGQRSSFGTKYPDTKTGIAMRANDENGLILFDADDGAQATIWSDDIWWSSADSGGERSPDCVREPHRKARVEAGFIRISSPGGGWFEKVVWLRCL
ncbi:MAG: hypothetical protein NTV23_05375 [Propionibacteriales bacterium]|nr:hypothetical protein [Propionibacteriales bacterium]